MTQPADVGSKRLISLAPENWVRWVTQFPDVEVRDIITSGSKRGMWQFLAVMNQSLPTCRRVKTIA